MDQMDKIMRSDIPDYETHDQLFFETPVLSISQTATLVGVSPRTIYRLVREGKIPCKRVGGQIRIVRHLLMDWLEQE
jgi:excisionase family DNA binding protein